MSPWKWTERGAGGGGRRSKKGVWYDYAYLALSESRAGNRNEIFTSPCITSHAKCKMESIFTRFMVRNSAQHETVSVKCIKELSRALFRRTLVKFVFSNSHFAPCSFAVQVEERKANFNRIQFYCHFEAALRRYSICRNAKW